MEKLPKKASKELQKFVHKIIKTRVKLWDKMIKKKKYRNKALLEIIDVDAGQIRYDFVDKPEVSQQRNFEHRGVTIAEYKERNKTWWWIE